MGRAWSGAAWQDVLGVSALARCVSRFWPPDLASPSPSPAGGGLSWSSLGPIYPPRWWPPSFDLSHGLSVLDAVIWPLVVAVESVALGSMLCFFFLFCGCNI